MHRLAWFENETINKYTEIMKTLYQNRNLMFIAAKNERENKKINHITKQ